MKNNRNIESWNAIQELQREAETEIPHCAMVAAIDLSLDDGIHIGTQDLKRRGVRLAHVALGLPREPRPASATLLPGNAIRVAYTEVNGRLEAPGRIAGFSIYTAAGEPFPLIFKALVDPQDGRAILLYLDNKLPEGAALRYGYGKDPDCNLRDPADLAAPVFGPMEIIR